MLFKVIIFLIFFKPLDGWTMQNTLNKDDLSSYRWKNRLLLVYSRTDEHKKSKEEQIALFDQNLNENDIRKLLLIPFKKTNAAFLNKFLKMKPFKVLLIGLDGSVKKSFNEPIKMNLVYDLIDSMPMRKREMNKNQDTK